MSVQLGLVMTGMGLRYLQQSARQAVYQSTHPPFNKSACPPQREMHKADAAVRGERSEEGPWMMSMSLGLSWETGQSKRRTVADTSTLCWTGRSLVISVIFIQRESQVTAHAKICTAYQQTLMSMEPKIKHLASFKFLHMYRMPHSYGIRQMVNGKRDVILVYESRTEILIRPAESTGNSNSR